MEKYAKVEGEICKKKKKREMASGSLVYVPNVSVWKKRSGKKCKYFLGAQMLKGGIFKG